MQRGVVHLGGGDALLEREEVELTIEGVRVVIDSGLMWRAAQNVVAKNPANVSPNRA